MGSKTANIAKDMVLITGITGFLGQSLSKAQAQHLANSDHLIGALVVTVSIMALAEVMRPVRFVNLLLAAALMASPLMLEGGSRLADWSGVAAALLLIAACLPRGKIENRYGGWSRYLF